MGDDESPALIKTEKRVIAFMTFEIYWVRTPIDIGDDNLNRFSEGLTHFINIMMALSLGLMSIFVFGNVVLRYAFNSGLTWSEEIARFLFVWLTFLGAVGALKDNGHLVVDMLINKLSPAMKKLVFVIANIIILVILWLIADGSWKMTLLNMENYSPAIGLPLSYIFVAGLVMAVLMALIVFIKIYQFLFQGSTSPEEMTDSGRKVAEGGN